MIHVGGFRPPEDQLASWFGKVLWMGRHEYWPLHENKPMWPLMQLNLRESPFVPPALRAHEFMTVFVGTNELFANENGNGWCLRTYKSIDELIQVEAPRHNSEVRPFPIRFELVEADISEYDALVLEEMGLPLEDAVNFDERFGDYYELIGGPAEYTKLGGWPSTLQHGVYYVGEPNTPPTTEEYEFVMQIDAEPKAKWYWPGQGRAYLGVNGSGDWMIQVQMW